MKNDLKHISPWRGLASYEDPNIAKHDYKFCGRDTESLEVAKLVDNNLFVTVYGRTGVGKTSLLNAGVFPILRNIDYYPIYVRLSYGAENGDYAKTIIKAIEKSGLFIESLFKYNDKTNDNKESKQITILWQYFCTHKFKINETTTEYVFPVIVLDQFEEIFFQKREQAKILLQQIYYLLSDNLIVPEGWSTETNYRFVASIREDNLYLLEDVIDELALPVFKENRYRLRAMSSENAKEAILTPGVSCLKKGEETEIAKKIIQNATEKDGSISSLILSLLCNLIWKRAEQKNKENPVITKEDVPDDKESTDTILTEFYLSHTTKKQRSIIEQHYLTEDGHRKSSSVEIPNVNKLTASDSRIIREVGAEREKSFELTHDRIAKVAYRQKRKKEDNKARILTSVILIGILSLFTYLTFRFAWSSTVKNRRFALYEPKTNPTSDIKEITKENPDTVRLFDDEIKRVSISNDVYTVRGNWKQGLSILLRQNHPTLQLDTMWVNRNTVQYLHYKKNNHLYLTTDSIIYSSTFIYSSNVTRLPYGVDSLKRSYGEAIKTNVNYPYGIESIEFNQRNDSLLNTFTICRNDRHIKSVALNNIKEIPSYAFENCINLTEINLDSVVEIGDYAFSGCENLKEICFTADSVVLGENAFEKCRNLKKVRFPRQLNLTSSHQLFNGCVNLEEITLPDTIIYDNNDSMCYRIFTLCYNLKNIKFRSDNHSNFKYDKDSILYFKKNTKNLPLILNRYNKESFPDSSDFFYHEPGVILNKNYLANAYVFKNYILTISKNSKWEKGVGYEYLRARSKNSIIYKDPTRNRIFDYYYEYVRPQETDSILVIKEAAGVYIVEANRNLKEIHLSNAEIDSLTFPANADNIKEQITLYVPYGSRLKYIKNESFKGFLDIKEDSLWKRVKDTCVYMWAGIAFSFNRYWWFYPLVALGLFVLGWIFYRIKKRQLANNGERSTRKAIWAAINGVPIAIVCFMPPYWMIFEYIMNNVDSPNYNTYGMIWGTAGGVISAYICSYLFIFAGKGKIWKSVSKMKISSD